MLKSLLTKLKSQHSDSVSNKAQTLPEIISNNVQNIQPQPSYQFKQLQAHNKVICQISTIRYSVQPAAPDLYNKILGCPISHFNQLPYAKRKVKEIDLKTDPCPSYLDCLKEVLKEQLPQFNHLLINVYPAGVGIMPHFDGPLYKSKVVVLSLGGPAIIHFSDSYASTNKMVLLEDRSLHIFQDQAYEKCRHGILDYVIDSIFLQIKWQATRKQYQVQRCSLSNFLLTSLFRVLKYVVLDRIQGQSSFQEVDLSKDYGSICSFIPINQNQAYNCKLELVRKERISITIRHKFTQTNNTTQNLQNML